MNITMYNQTTYRAAELEKDIISHLQPIEVLKVMSAYDMAEHIHEHQVRNDNSPYFFHCARVCKILVKELGIYEADLLIAALTHDVLEDSKDVTYDVLAYNFGNYAAYIVQVLTKDLHKQKLDSDTIEKEHIELLKKSTIDCLIVKLAARLDNFRCLDVNLKKYPLIYVNKTTELYLPLADTSSHPALLFLARELRKERNKFLG